uniref:Uncharacterized protein n=1 Tax=Arundo donax TaxID=35708 RepID=A0A0A9F5Q2_ARUDO
MFMGDQHMITFKSLQEIYPDKRSCSRNFAPFFGQKRFKDYRDPEERLLTLSFR